MTSLYELSATEILEKIKTKVIKPSEVAEIFLKRIYEVNPVVNAIHQIEADRIMQQAFHDDIIINSHSSLDNLFGLPISIKDAFHVKNFYCSKGSLGLLQKKSDFDATAVSRVRKAGANIFGLTNTSELLLAYEADNLIYGQTKNPYDLNRTSGGSSGGSAAIVALGGTPVSIGNDAAGSLRLPSHYCGVCSHKPTHGLIPNTGNIPADGFGIASQIISIGPIARYVDDLILLMEILCGPDGIDPYAKPVPFNRDSPFDLTQLKVAYFYENPSENSPTKATINAVDSIINILRPRVKEVKEAFPPQLKQIYRLHFETLILGGDKGRTLLTLINKFENKRISPLTEKFIEIAKKCEFSIDCLKQRFIEIDRLRISMNLFINDFDIIISPVSATPARRHGESFDNIQDFGYIMAHNLTGWPTTVIPCAFSEEGLPIGIQIISKPWQDNLTLNLALLLQKTLGVFKIPKLTDI